MTVLTTLIISGLGLVIWQDMKFRAITWVLFPVLMLAFVWMGLAGGDDRFPFYLLMNITLISCQLLCLVLWFSYRERRWINPVNEKLGLGDVLLLYVLCAAFHPATYVIFLAFAFPVCLCFHLLIRRKLKDGVHLPLAAYLAGGYLLFALMLKTWGMTPYEDIFTHYYI